MPIWLTELLGGLGRLLGGLRKARSTAEIKAEHEAELDRQRARRDREYRLKFGTDSRDPDR